MKYLLVSTSEDHFPKVIREFDYYHEALEIMESIVVDIVVKQNGIANFKIDDFEIKENQRYQNKEYVADIERPKVCSRFPIIDVATTHLMSERKEPSLYEVPVGNYFIVRDSAYMSQLSVYERVDNSGRFRSGYVDRNKLNISIVEYSITDKSEEEMYELPMIYSNEEYSMAVASLHEQPAFIRRKSVDNGFTEEEVEGFEKILNPEEEEKVEVEELKEEEDLEEES